jgi:hypothetical protein
MKPTKLVGVAVVLGVSSAPALADFVTVDIGVSVNADVRSFTNGSFYPVGGQTVPFGGVPFALATVSANPASLGGFLTNLDSVEYSVSIAGAARVYTLVNSGFGSLGAPNGFLEVFGTGGAFARLDYVQGLNIRDHFQNAFQNQISDPTVFATEFGGGVRLDRQVLELPSAFDGQTVTLIRFTGTSVGGPGVPFLTGVTVQLVPGPGAAGLAAIGVLAIGRRRRMG